MDGQVYSYQKAPYTQKSYAFQALILGPDVRAALSAMDHDVVTGLYISVTHWKHLGPGVAKKFKGLCGLKV